MRWILIVLLMCNGIYFLWQNYLLQNDSLKAPPPTTVAGEVGSGLRLLSEMEEASALSDPGADSGPASVEKMVVESVSPVSQEEAGPKMCLLIGPFKEEVTGRQVVNRLAALDIVPELQSIAIPGEPDYWVHLPPRVSRREAIKLLRELQVKKIDSFLITEGELANGISLGFFTQKARAENVYAQRVKEGYGAAIKVVPRSRTEIWAVLSANEYSKFSDALWDKIKEGNKDLQRRKNYCDKIASTDNFD